MSPLPDEARYEIRIAAELDDGWSAWFGGMEVRNDGPGRTVLIGSVPDQAALHGLLTRIADLGLPLISLRRIDPR
ncbi:hypothetical protein SAMN05216207_1022109 [Pseudonocardia ammonioxydans]|uniref:Uncharacterized protein n=1 Tax=Pseudonocardia ammonioxydans TaxID=260086 RepID=A0A1I5CD71_PSUAM|nr:hypothetical protein [Pseudonocardia ammonioxydans]SFN84601.1 hypothetical protein SAMN05216207_1022109 [Pseudonocardia ammonioxydans]